MKSVNDRRYDARDRPLLRVSDDVRDQVCGRVRMEVFANVREPARQVQLVFRVVRVGAFAQIRDPNLTQIFVWDDRFR